MSKTISLNQLPRQVESLLLEACEGRDNVVLERDGELVAAVVPIEEYLRLHPETKKTEEMVETTKTPSDLSYELPADLLDAYHSLLNKKFSYGLTPDEEYELVQLDKQLDEAELATPLVQSTLTKAEQQHKQWMRRKTKSSVAFCTLDEVIAKAFPENKFVQRFLFSPENREIRS